jgi:hypothetical protein
MVLDHERLDVYLVALDFLERRRLRAMERDFAERLWAMSEAWSGARLGA